MLALVAIIFNQAERRIEREIEEKRSQNNIFIETERSRENSFQTYIDNMTDFIRTNEKEELLINNIQVIIRVRTLTILRILDSDRKSLIVRFLYEIGLIKNPDFQNNEPIELREADLDDINLKNANLINIYLPEVNLCNANLSGANLQKANFTQTNFTNTNLEKADLYKANLSGADLHNANLESSDLTYADLSGTDLSKANLKGAIVTDEQLLLCESLKETILVNGNIHD